MRERIVSSTHRFHPAALAVVFREIRRRSAAAGSDGLTPVAYEGDLDRRLERLSQELSDATYRPSRLLRITKPKPDGRLRRLAIPTVEDRIVLEVLRAAIEPMVEPVLSPSAYAYRRGRSPREAVDAVLAHRKRGATFVALGDIRDFFDSVPLGPVVEATSALTGDPELTALLSRVLTAHAMRPGVGLAQGSSLSPVLSNLALLPLDRRLAARGHDLVRYCDNLCIPAGNESDARSALSAIHEEVRRAGLRLKDSEARVCSFAEGFVWLGFRLGESGGRVSEGALSALVARVDAAARGLEGDALAARLLPIVRGWVQYFDAPLPESVSLGAHGALVRTLLEQTRPHVAAAPDPPTEIEPWDDEPDAEPANEAEADRLLDEAERLATSGDFLGAERAFEAARTLREAPPAAPVTEEPEYLVDDEALDTCLGLFCAGQDTFESLPRGSTDRRDFARISTPPGPTELREHLCGLRAMAILPRLPDGTSTLGVIDLDATEPAAHDAVLAYAEAVRSAARSRGLELLLEHTGGRGAHLWLPVDGKVPAGLVADTLSHLIGVAGTPGAGVRVEALPGRDHAPDLHEQAITLPLGVHPETGQPSHLLLSDGTAVGPELLELGRVKPNHPSLLGNLDNHARTQAPLAEDRSEALPAWEDLGAPVARMMSGCAILRHLAQKAAAVGHLSHAERLSLLYSLGHLGAPGERAIHAIISTCRNYDVLETSRQIAKLTGLPIGCTRLREKHGTEATCRCDFEEVRRRGGYPTPLLHAGGFRREWREILRERRLAETEEPGGVVAVAEEVPDAGPPSAGTLLKGVPPHEWA